MAVEADAQVLDPSDVPPRRRRWFRSTPWALSAKLLLLLVLVLLLGIALGLVEGLVNEREGRHRSVGREVGALWGDPQRLAGPVLAVPYGVPGERPGIEHAIEQGVLYFLPEDLSFEATVEPEVRRRGIFEAVVYRLDAVITGRFSRPQMAAFDAAVADAGAGDDALPLWGRAFVAVGVPDMRSVGEVVQLEVGGTAHPFRPGTRMGELLESGMSADLPDAHALLGEDGLAFRIQLTLNGSESVSFVPLGRETRATVSSPWPAPSFSGAYLPTRHQIDAEGFSADWSLSYFGREYPQVLREETLPSDIRARLAASAFGVRLHQPVTPYRQVQRAIKYGMLFLVFTFGFYFMVEAITRRRIHPVQYATVGVPLCLFYLLLVAFAEHIGFLVAYVIGAGAVIALIALYSWKVLGSVRRMTWIATLLAGLYGYLYTLLEQESYSLVWGSCGLLVLTGAFMYVTRDVDWYGAGSESDRHQPATAAA